jgi:hypothetical protein
MLFSRDLPQNLEDVALAFRLFIQAENPMAGQRHPSRQGTWSPPIRSPSAIVWWGAQHGRAVTTAVRSLVRAATRGCGWCRWPRPGSDRGGSWSGAGRPQEQDVGVRTPAFPTASLEPFGISTDTPFKPPLNWKHGEGPYHDNSSSSALASWRSAVSKPSVNQP